MECANMEAYKYIFMQNTKTLIFEQISSLSWKQAQSEKNLATFVLKNREKIKKIVSQNEQVQANYASWNHINWYLFFADYREYLWFLKYMDLDLFNAFTEKVMTSWDEVNYDDFLKIFKKAKPKTRLPKWYKWPEVKKLIKNQWEYLAQWLVELVANAIDATSSEKTIWRFWEWFYQALKFLKWWNAELTVTSKKSEEKWFLLSFLEEDGVNKVWTVWMEKEDIWTEVELKKKLSQKEIQDLKTFLINAFKTNKRVNIFLNSEKVNNFGEYNYYNGELLSSPTGNVFIEINESWFKVVDSWVWMSAKDLSERLLQPTSSWKKRINPDSMKDEELERNTLWETAFFYKRFENGKKTKKDANEKTLQKTSIRLQVWWVLIESFEKLTSYDISEFCLEFPSFTWLPESRNEVQLTKEVVVSLKHAIEKISEKVEDDTEKIMLLELLWKIIEHLKSRESSKVSTKSKYDIDKVAKNVFKSLMQNLEAKWKTVLPSIPELQAVLSWNDDIIFVDPLFLNFDVKKIPWVQKLKNVRNAKVEFYQIEFSKEAEYDYLILKWIVLVNAKYTKNQDTIDLINTQVNLNTGYEQWDDIVFYGVIEDDEDAEREKKEDSFWKEGNIISWENIMKEELYTDEEVENYIKNLEYIKDNFWEYFDIFSIENTIKNTKEILLRRIKNRSYGEFVFSLEKLTFYEFSMKHFVKFELFNTFSDYFHRVFFNFIKENSKEIFKIFVDFFIKIKKINEAEKYLLQVMSLLDDEKNAKYIAEYLGEFDSLSESDIKNLFAYFEWEEIVAEEIQPDAYLKILRERWPDVLWDCLKLNLFPWRKDVSCERIYEYNWTVAYVVESWYPEVSTLYIWDKPQIINWKRQHWCMNWFRVINWKIFVELDDWTFYYDWKVYKFSDFVWRSDAKVDFVRTDKQLIYICSSHWKEWLWVIDLNTLETQKPESEYLRIYTEEWSRKFIEFLKMQNPDIWDVEVYGIIEWIWDVCYKVENKNRTESLYIWNRKLQIDWKTDFHFIILWDFKDGKILWRYQEKPNVNKEQFIFDIATLSSHDFKLDFSQYSQKTLAFIEFLCKWWEFLTEKNFEVAFESEESLLLTDIIGISKNFDEAMTHHWEWDEKLLLQELKTKIEKELKNRNLFQRQITSTIDGQDRSSMIWLREVVQNSRDAILKAKRNGNSSPRVDEVNIDFYQNNWSWVSKITDTIWMSPFEVFTYLLTPGMSWKEWDETATWMFGQWFYSLAIGASEVRLKTSFWNGKTTYVKLIPIYNENHDLIDFDIVYDIKDEDFKGTVIERIDEEKWVWGNIGALVWLQNLSKYVWNVDDIHIQYNGKTIFHPNDIKILQTEGIWELWTLSLKQNKDKKERLTKDNLFISDIKDGYVNFFPDWIREYIASTWFSLDLPKGIELTKTRNAVSDFEEDIEILRPYIFNVFTRQIVKDYLEEKAKIPMMPLDYFWLDLYEVEYNSEIVSLASRVNTWWVLSFYEIQKLQDKNAMVQYLICLEIENSWEKISIRELKKRRDDTFALARHTDNQYIKNHNAQSLNTNMEVWDRQYLDVEDDNDKKRFLEKMQIKFGKLTRRLLGCQIYFWFYERKDKDENRAVDYWFDTTWDIYFNFNARFWEKFKTNEDYKMIELVTHEFTHVVEEMVKWFWIDFEEKVIHWWESLGSLVWIRSKLWYLSKVNFWSHQKDLTNEHSFERIQRQILKMMTREGL